MNSTQGIPVESFESQTDAFSDYFYMWRQHDDMCFIQTVQCRVIAVDKLAQITDIPKMKDETVQERKEIKYWFLSFLVSYG